VTIGRSDAATGVMIGGDVELDMARACIGSSSKLDFIVVIIIVLLFYTNILRVSGYIRNEYPSLIISII